MRLTCPNCGAAYEVGMDRVPEAGRHVQCSACHTRWFVRRPAAETRDEDSIIRALETRRAKPRLVPDPDPAAGDAAETAGPERDEDGAENFEWHGGSPPGEEAEPDPDAPTGTDAETAKPDTAPIAAGIDSLAPSVPRPAQLPASMVTGPGRTPPAVGENAAPAAAADPAAAPAPVPPAPVPPAPVSPRIDLTHTVSQAPLRPPPAPRRGGFAVGLATALVLTAGLVAVYSEADRLADLAPAIAPALETYTGWVDAARQVFAQVATTG